MTIFRERSGRERKAAVVSGVCWIEGQVFVVQLEVVLEDGNDKRVIFALRQTGGCNRADAASSDKKNGEAATVSGVVLQVESQCTLQSGVSALVFQADRVGAVMETYDHVAFAANPIPIVRCGSRHRKRK